MRDVESTVDVCKHNTPKGIAWKKVHRERRLFGLWTYTTIEKECQACGQTFLTDLKGRRLLN